MSQVNTWDPTIAGQEVRLRSNPGQRGTTTGKTKTSGSRLLVQVQFGATEKSYKPYELLELCGEPEGISELLGEKHCSGPDDLRRILTLEKIKGQLTNIFYSMESSNTDFYPHQFKPVLKFLESPVGRILIADEVGLGKTIEAMYIWKELQVRADARRLLIICPAILRQKWQDDLKQRFSILVEMVSAKELLARVKLTLETQQPVSFACVASLEGLRPASNWDDEQNNDARSELARLLDQNNEFGLFDLVVIDEAHYLRNPSTANNRMAQLVRDAARHTILLTATPIQTHNVNLYQLLKLISPEDFPSEDIFQDMLKANAPLIQAFRYTSCIPPNPRKAAQELAQALKSKYFSQNSVLKQIYAQLTEPDALTPEQLIDLGRRLESASLISQYLTRSRKREVIPNRVERAPQTLQVSFSSLEQQIYEQVTQQIRQQSKGQQGVSFFRLVARQRQMASCMVAALRSWAKRGILDDLLDEELWEDFGITTALNADAELEPGWNNQDGLLPSQKIDYELLEKQDTKYRELVKFLKNELSRLPGEKFVLFAYFRETLYYLQRRLREDGISTCLILGDMGETKWETLQEFREGPASVLLSSEVGSEGIDLQFCRFLINYDLPWNPMRVEQRIGRLDRLGQKSERISIINFSLVDTIEERILERLYERINIFHESIGDLENILGEVTEKLLTSLFNPSLTNLEREQKAEETAKSLLRQRIEQDHLEKEAVNLMAFSDHILNAVSQSRSQGRWLTPEELYLFVEDFFARDYPGTRIEPLKERKHTFLISLSEEAKVALKEFIIQHRCSVTTNLHTIKTSCCFDPKSANDSRGKRAELIQPTHPLIQWIRHYYESQNQQYHPISAIQIDRRNIDLTPGLYVYGINRWSFAGLRTENRLVCKAARYSDGQMITDDQSETLIARAVRWGISKPNAANLIDDFDRVIELYQQCAEYMEGLFDLSADTFAAENSNRCEIQQRSAEAYANRKRQQLQEQLERFRQERKLRMVPATEGRLNKVNQELQLKLNAIERRREISLAQTELGAGVIFVD